MHNVLAYIFVLLRQYNVIACSFLYAICAVLLKIEFRVVSTLPKVPWLNQGFGGMVQLWLTMVKTVWSTVYHS